MSAKTSPQSAEEPVAACEDADEIKNAITIPKKTCNAQPLNEDKRSEVIPVQTTLQKIGAAYSKTTVCAAEVKRQSLRDQKNSAANKSPTKTPCGK